MSSVPAPSLLSAAMDSVATSIVLVDPAGPGFPIIFANPAFLAMTGYPLAEVLGRNCRFLQGPETDRETVGRIRAALAARQPFHGTLLNYRKDGTPFWNTLAINPVFNEAGELTHFVGAQTDVSARIRAEESARRLAAIVESSDDAIVGKSLDGRITSWNAGASALFGYAEAEVLGRLTTSVLVPPERAEEEKHILAGIGRGERVRHFETIRLHKDGCPIEVSLAISPVKNAGGAVIGASVILRDIHERRRTEERLSQSETNYRRLFDTNPLPTWVYDVSTLAFLAVNRAAVEHYGYSREEFLSMTLGDVRPAEDLPKLLRVIASLGADSRRRRAWRHLKKDGTMIRVEVAPDNLVFAGRPARLAVIHDVTERHRIEERLRLLESVTVNANDVVIISEAEPVEEPGPRIIYANQAFTRITGYTEAEVLGKNPRFLQGPNTDPSAKEKIHRALKRWQPVRAELVNYHKDGSEFWVELNIVPVADETGRFTHWVSVQRDITERKQAEAALRESEARHRHITANVPGMVYQFVLRPDGSSTFPYVSEGARAIYGLDPQEIQRDPAALLRAVPASERPGFRRSIAESAATLQAWKWEGRIILPGSGEEKWVQGISRPEQQANGDTVWDGILLDITDRKRTIELQRAKNEAERANAAKSEFLSRMSHELRTPLNAILGFSQLLELGDLDAQEREGVEHILKGGRHLLALIDEVLDLARIESGRVELSPESVSVPALLREALGLIQPLAARRGITLRAPEWGPPPDHRFSVQADRQRLKQVLLNLLSNAVKYNVEGGSVTLECAPAASSAGGRLRLRIADTGPGIPADRRAGLFVPFERLGAEHTAVQGTGLGLALSKRLVEAMDGSLGLEESAAGATGAVFYVDLPLANSPAPEPAAQLLTSRGNGAFTAVPAARTLLYVEDNLSNLRLIEHLLTRCPGVHLLSAMQGRLGLELAREHRPDVILLDLHLPDLPGGEVLTQLQADPATRAIPVVVISADATERQIERLRQAGARAYLTKPINVELFLRTLQECLGAPSATA